MRELTLGGIKMESFKSVRRFAILSVVLALVAYGMTVRDLTAEATGPPDIGYVYDGDCPILCVSSAACCHR